VDIEARSVFFVDAEATGLDVQMLGCSLDIGKVFVSRVIAHEFPSVLVEKTILGTNDKNRQFDLSGYYRCWQNRH
jgi:hypothetical protein